MSNGIGSLFCRVGETDHEDEEEDADEGGQEYVDDDDEDEDDYNELPQEEEGLRESTS